MSVVTESQMRALVASGAMRLVLAAALLLAGCAAPAASPSPGAEDAPHDAGAAGQGSAHVDDLVECAHLGSWTQPALIEALIARGAEALPPPDGILFDASSLGFEADALLSYLWHERGREVMGLHVERGVPHLAALLQPETTREEARAWFEEVADRLIEADDAERARLFESFWSARRPGELSGENVTLYDHAVAVEPQPERAVAGLEARATSTRDLFGAQVGIAWPDGWKAQLSFEERRLMVPGLVLRAAAHGGVQASAPDLVEEPHSYIAERMRAAGLPEPYFQDWRNGGSIC